MTLLKAMAIKASTLPWAISAKVAGPALTSSGFSAPVPEHAEVEDWKWRLDTKSGVA